MLHFMKHLALLLFLINAVPVFAQDKTIDNKGKFSLKWNPFTLLSYSSIQLGSEYFYKPNWSLAAECGIILPMYEAAAITPENNHGYRFKLQHRYYIHNFFVGPEIHILNVRYKNNEVFASQFITDSTGVTMPLDDTGYTINVRKNVVCFNLTGGVQHLKGRKIGAEFFGGLGIRYENLKFEQRPAGKEYVPYYSDVFPSELDNNEEGKRFLPNVTLGLRLIWLLGKR